MHDYYFITIITFYFYIVINLFQIKKEYCILNYNLYKICIKLIYNIYKIDNNKKKRLKSFIIS